MDTVHNRNSCNIPWSQIFKLFIIFKFKIIDSYLQQINNKVNEYK
jgi:hypothetical protein